MKRTELMFERSAQLQATRPPEARGLERDEVRLLVSSSKGHEHARFRDLPRFLEPGTLLVVNRSATLPASLRAEHRRLGSIVINFSTHYGGGLWLIEPRWSHDRPGPLPLDSGERIEARGLTLQPVATYPGLPRLWFVQVQGDVHAAMQIGGQPIRYGYIKEPFPVLAAYQTVFSQTPGSAEMPSAARPFTHRVINELKASGIKLVGITLHTGVSSHEVETEDVEDQTLYAEPYEVSQEAADAINAARREGRPVIAVGTTVIRALESAWDHKQIQPAAGFTRVFVHPDRPVQTVDGLITGLHDPLASHLAMLYALADPDLIRDGYREAVNEGYLWHEFGDSHLILPNPPRNKRSGLVMCKVRASV